MATYTTRDEFKGVGQALEINAEGDSAFEQRFEFRVRGPEDVIMVTATGSGRMGFTRAASNARVMLIDPKGERIDLVEPERGKGPTEILIPKPMSGTWTLSVGGGEAHDVNVNAAVIEKEGFRMPMRWLGRFGCRACRKLLKTLIILLLIKITGGLAVGLGLDQAIQAVLSAIGDALDWFRVAMEMSDGALSAFLSFLSELLPDPIDDIMRKVCTRLGFCP